MELYKQSSTIISHCSGQFLGLILMTILVVGCGRESKTVVRAELLKEKPFVLLQEKDLDSSLVAVTESGKVLGAMHEKGIIRFTSIPFASGPIDTLRYRAPIPPKPWEDVLDTRKICPKCVQQPAIGDEQWSGGESEDCLWLTVNTPSLDTKKRPVIVWIHGGSLVNGGAGHPTYDGASLSSRGDIVFVNIQYRLGVFGWLNVSHIGGEMGSQFNGRLDQLLALKWVRNNIDNFGGDPDNITLMGNSDGSFSANSILQMPEADELFHKAILSSGLGTPYKAPPTTEITNSFIELLGVGSLKELQQLPSEDIRDAGEELNEIIKDQGYLNHPTPLFGPLKWDRNLLLAAGKKGKPIMHGTTADEYHGVLPYYDLDQDDGLRITDRVFYSKSVGLTRKDAKKLIKTLKKYKPADNVNQKNNLYIDVLSNAFVQYPHEILDKTYGQNAPTYRYIFNLGSPVMENQEAIHMSDMPYFFGTLDTFKDLIGDNPIKSLSMKMQDCIIAFSRTGNPNHESIPNWPIYDPSNKSIMVFDKVSEVKDNPMPWMEKFGKVYEKTTNQD